MLFLNGINIKAIKGTKMNNNKRLSKQAGGVSKIMLIMIVAGLGYSAYLAEKKGLISRDSLSSITNSVSDKLSSGFNSISSNGYSGYGIQLMATRELIQAKSLMNDFARDGYSAFVVESKTKGRSIYKVRLGPYSHKPEAVAVQDKVIRRYPSNPYVKASLVIYKPH